MANDFLKNGRGGFYLLKDGYKYSIKSRRNDRCYWRCVNRDCRETLTTMNNISILFGQEHNHPSDYLCLGAAAFINSVKKRFCEDVSRVSAISDEELQNPHLGKAILEISGQCQSQKRSILYKQVRKFSDTTENTDDSTLRTSRDERSLIECLSLCSKHDSCKSIIFSKEGGNVCELRNSAFDNLLEPVTQPEAKYYQRIERGCDESRYLVSGQWPVSDEQIIASSEWSPQNGKVFHGPERSRLHTKFYIDAEGYIYMGAWVAELQTIDQYIQVELLFNSIVTGVSTQGRNVDVSSGCCMQWVKKYRLLYSMDGNSWQCVTDTSGDVKIFNGNDDSDTVVTHMLSSPFTAKYVRFNPWEWNAFISMRFDVLGYRD